MILRCTAAGALEAVIGGIHDRMPVILDERMAEDWMNPRKKNLLSLKRLLVPAPSDLLVMQPASPLANSVKNEDTTLLKAQRRCSKPRTRPQTHARCSRHLLVAGTIRK